MGQKDTVTTKYMRQNEIFADAFNYFVYDGKPVIRPNSLEELDTKEIAVPYGGEKGAKQPIQRIRDVIKSVTAMTDRKRAYLILAIENQAHIHYAISVKNMVYDALQYAKQVERAIATHRESGDYHGTDSDEYLSGFLKSDRLMPVLTLVIYFGAKAWDGPTSIHEMFEEQDPKILSFVPDYRVNLIVPAMIDDSEFGKFRTTLKEVLSFIKYSEDKQKLKALVEKDEKFTHLGRNEVDVLNECTGVKLAMNKGKKEHNVCKAIRDIAQEAASQERTNTLLKAVKNLMNNMEWTTEQAMDAMGVPEEEREMLVSQL